MKCLSCETFSMDIVCKECQKKILEPSFNTRELEDGFNVYSFYEFEIIKDFIESKYYFYGDRIYHILGNLAFKKFAQNFQYKDALVAIPIMDKNFKEYHQSTILAKYLKNKNISIKFNSLVATNSVKYAGKSLEYRQNNPRNFQYSGKNNIDVILVDDLVTTGSTLIEAKKILENNNCNVLFALTLADAKH